MALGIHVRPYVDDVLNCLRGGFLLVVTREMAARQGVTEQWDATHGKCFDVGHAPSQPDWQDVYDLYNACGNLVGQGRVPACDWIVSISLTPVVCQGDV